MVLEIFGIDGVQQDGDLPDLSHFELVFRREQEAHELHGGFFVLGLLEEDHILAADHVDGTTGSGWEGTGGDLFIGELGFDDGEGPGTIVEAGVAVLCVAGEDIDAAAHDDRGDAVVII